MKAIEVIEASIKSHQDWIDFVTDNPEYCGETHGDSKFHQDRIDDYNLAIAGIEQLQAESGRLKACKVFYDHIRKCVDERYTDCNHVVCTICNKTFEQITQVEEQALKGE